MNEALIEIRYKIYNDISELPEADSWLLNEAREITRQAYAPYSNFHVAAVAKMVNGKIVAGTNQENASFPAGLCAERVLLSAASTLYPGEAIDTIAISYHDGNGNSRVPVSPCGICRQSLREFEYRTQKSIRLILGGMEGQVFVFEQASLLLPLAFTAKELKGYI